MFGTVIEIINEEGFLLKTSYGDKPKKVKIFLSNIKSVRSELEAPRGYVCVLIYL